LDKATRWGPGRQLGHTPKDGGHHGVQPGRRRRFSSGGEFVAEVVEKNFNTWRTLKAGNIIKKVVRFRAKRAFIGKCKTWMI
jgi:hypothetical protein